MDVEAKLELRKKQNGHQVRAVPVIFGSEPVINKRTAQRPTKWSENEKDDGSSRSTVWNEWTSYAQSAPSNGNTKREISYVSESLSGRGNDVPYIHM